MSIGGEWGRRQPFLVVEVDADGIGLVSEANMLGLIDTLGPDDNAVSVDAGFRP